MKSAELTSAERLFEWQATSIDRVKVVFKPNFIEALTEHDKEIRDKIEEMIKEKELNVEEAIRNDENYNRTCYTSEIEALTELLTFIIH